ncbi:iron complex outermembrane receptor protein [Paracidovorax wautersii]|uniref:Iron complex outermembrane receptor protein n=2 Tax=Paracidovorax wautersii TaxID=1177982 RepID=A0ABU1ICC8_9BURK|nr:iron complex outermembrane receptor protein [Paracidovorax wautersii]
MNSMNRHASRSDFRCTPLPLVRVLRQCLGAGLALAAVGAAAQTSGTTTLDQVTVSDQAEAIGGLQKTYSGGQLARGGDLGLLGRVDLMSVPFSTTNYTSELIANQQAQSVADVVMNDASVRPMASRGGFGDDFQIRGFTVGNGDLAINGLYGLAPSTRIPLESIERVEVLKGPGALTNGVGPNGSVGGSINAVSKRAGDAPLTRLTTSYMSKSNLAAHLDVGRRFGEDNQWGVRVNGLVRGGEGTIDGGKQNLNLGSIALDYAGARTRWSLDATASRGETDDFRNHITLPTTGGIPAVPDTRTAWYPGTELKDNFKLVTSRLEHDLTDSTTVYGSVGWSKLDYKQDFPGGRGLDANGNFTVSNAWYDQYTDSKAADVGLRTRFTTGAIKHTVALGMNYMAQETGYFYATGGSAPSSLYNPVRAPAMTGVRGAPGKSVENHQHSFAIADTLGFFNDSLLVTLGLRRQTMDYEGFNVATGASTSQYKASSTTPLAGVVFKPTRSTSVYANYTAGLSRGSKVAENATPAYDNAGETIPPFKSKQIEMGVKVDWGQLTTQAAVYQIKRPSAYSTPSASNPALQHYSYDGEQRNRGLELTAYGELQRGLRLMASVAFTEAELTRTQGGVNQDKKVSGVPDRNYNLGLDWDAPWVPGLSLNGRVVSSSSVYRNADNTLSTPSWTRLDIGARYATKLSGKPVVLRANLENVSDKGYWITGINGYSTTGLPRTLTLSAQFDF